MLVDFASPKAIDKHQATTRHLHGFTQAAVFLALATSFGRTLEQDDGSENSLAFHIGVRACRQPCTFS